MKEQFPVFETGVVYLDTAASSQKPLAVINNISNYYNKHHSNVHRGLHTLAEQATNMYESARTTVAQFINADVKEVIFTSGTTESINLLASSYPLTEDDTVILTELEHHSNIVPWQQAAKRVGATLKWIPVVDGEIDLQTAENMIKEGCSVLAISHLSNVTGSIQPIKELTQLVHAGGGRVFVDGAQAAAHIDIDVKALDVDAYAFSGHKMYGPTGIGVLYAKKELLDSLSPYQFGGEMIHEVKKEETTFANSPQKFEAGTPPIAQAVGLSSAIFWMKDHEKEKIPEQHVVFYANDELRNLPFIDVISCNSPTALVSFVVKDVHAHDVAQFLDSKNIAIRAGHHCTQVLHDSLGVTATCRASFGLYNTKEDVDTLIEALKQCKEAFNV